MTTYARSYFSSSSCEMGTDRAVLLRRSDILPLLPVRTRCRPPGEALTHNSCRKAVHLTENRETLDIKDAAAIDDKMFMPRDSVVIHEVPSPDFTAPPRLPAGRGGAI